MSEGKTLMCRLLAVYVCGRVCSGNTPLHYAAQKGLTAVFHKINSIPAQAKRRAAFSAPNAAGESPLHLAAKVFRLRMRVLCLGSLTQTRRVCVSILCELWVLHHSMDLMARQRRCCFLRRTAMHRTRTVSPHVSSVDCVVCVSMMKD